MATPPFIAWASIVEGTLRGAGSSSRFVRMFERAAEKAFDPLPSDGVIP